MTSSDFAPHSTPPAQLSPAQASFVYWLNGLAPVVTSIVTPLATYWTLRKKPDQTVIQKYNQQINEVVRQFVSGSVGLMGYFGGGETTKGLLYGAGKLFPDAMKLDEASKQVLMIVGGTFISFVGYAFVRPKISTELICSLLKQEERGLKRSYAHLSRYKPMRWLQKWADSNLIDPKSGAPNLAKMARYSAGFLTAYLGGGALLIGLLKNVFPHLSQSSASQPSVAQADVSSHRRSPFAVARPSAPTAMTPEHAHLYFARKVQDRSYSAMSQPGYGLGYRQSHPYRV